MSEDVATTDEAREDPTAGIAERLADGEVSVAVMMARALHPAEIASVIASLEAEPRSILLGRLHTIELAQIISYLEPIYRPMVYEGRTPPELRELAIALPDDLATDLIQSLPTEVADGVVAGLSRRARGLVQALLTHEPNSAAGRMTGQVFSVPPTYTVTQTIQALQRIRQKRDRPLHSYVVDTRDRLLGVVNFDDLLYASPDTRIQSLMEEAVIVRHDTPEEEAAQLLKRRKLLALPVVDADGCLLGALTVDDVIDVLEDTYTGDMLQLAGVDEEEALEGVIDSVRYRLPWLAMNLVALLLAAWVISLFESTIEQAAIIAVFLPVVLGQGGNGGLQTVTVVVRSLALGHISPRNTLRVTGTEMATGFITGSAVGITVGLLAWVWQGNYWLGLIVGAAIILNQLVGAIAGVGFPMGLQAVRQDPAVSAPIWLTNATDVLGSVALLYLATLLVSRL